MCYDLATFKSNLSLYLLYLAEACDKLAGSISASLRPANTAPFKEMSQRWRAVGNTVSDLISPRFEPRTSRSKDECVTARPTFNVGNIKQKKESHYWAQAGLSQNLMWL